MRAMSRLARCALVALVMVGCGPSASSSSSPDTSAGGEETAGPESCETLRAQEAETRAAVESCRASTPLPEWALRDDFEWLEEAIGARLDAARRGEEVSTGVVQMQEIAEHVWALLDEVPEAQRDAALLGRVEDGAEALMHPHTAEGRQEALAQVAGALGALRERLEPAPPADACEGPAREAAAAWMAVQAACGEE
ncbi:hypothetical protein DB32_008507 [Sandaracinus amylolyticus]|uniref:Secreted protein n=2 Tax=Sandaracinus amylolyticus TaxID=927083 RepID=A0A0F6WAA6_9BACT|nr:hypothetical protein DB32_008507 [Sandaracinus amylolyticus]